MTPSRRHRALENGASLTVRQEGVEILTTSSNFQIRTRTAKHELLGRPRLIVAVGWLGPRMKWLPGLPLCHVREFTRRLLLKGS